MVLYTKKKNLTKKLAGFSEDVIDDLYFYQT